ncbi:MAG: flavin-containing monooxygenase [Actinomycetes bacterium]
MSDHTVVVVGSGFAGVGLAIRLRAAGYTSTDDLLVLERADDLGGTWRDNHYPGAACDVPSHLYSYSFAPNPDWTRSFSPSGEIWDYLRGCADRYGVTPHVRVGCELLEAAWDEQAQRWRLQTSQGELTARVLVPAVGALSEPSIPPLPGLERFTGTVFHSAAWRHDHDLAGRRVAVVGTGASAIQFVPEIAPRTASLHVFQRTPPWVIPRRDRAISALERGLFRRVPAAQRLARTAIYLLRESTVPGFTGRRALMRPVERIARAHLRRQVPDPALRARLRPEYALGCKRLLLSNDWYPTLMRPDVEVVSSGVREVRPHSVVAADGTEREVDTIVFGTGFHVTDMPIGARVRGRDGLLLDDVWQGSPEAYLGSTVAGFPNMFMLIGPNTGLGHSSMILMIEAQVAYVEDALRRMDADGLATVDVRPEVQASYNAALQQAMQPTVWLQGGCASWYLDASGRNTTIWPGSTWRFAGRTRRFDLASYCATRTAARPVPGPGVPAVHGPAEAGHDGESRHDPRPHAEGAQTVVVPEEFPA